MPLSGGRRQDQTDIDQYSEQCAEVYQKGFVAFSVTAKQCGTDDMAMLSFRIEDTGCGIKEENLEEIFDNFK